MPHDEHRWLVEPTYDKWWDYDPHHTVVRAAHDEVVAARWKVIHAQSDGVDPATLDELIKARTDASDGFLAAVESVRGDRSQFFERVAAFEAAWEVLGLDRRCTSYDPADRRSYAWPCGRGPGRSDRGGQPIAGLFGQLPGASRPARDADGADDALRRAVQGARSGVGFVVRAVRAVVGNLVADVMWRKLSRRRAHDVAVAGAWRGLTCRLPQLVEVVPGLVGHLLRAHPARVRAGHPRGRSAARHPRPSEDDVV